MVAMRGYQLTEARIVIRLLAISSQTITERNISDGRTSPHLMRAGRIIHRVWISPIASIGTRKRRLRLELLADRRICYSSRHADFRGVIWREDRELPSPKARDRGHPRCGLERAAGSGPLVGLRRVPLGNADPDWGQYHPDVSRREEPSA